MPSPSAFGVSQFTTRPWPFEADVECCTQLGIGVLEVCEFKLQPDGYADQLAMLADNGIAVSSVQPIVHSLFPDSLAAHPATLRDRVARIESAIERIAPHVATGTPFVVVTGAAPGGDASAAYDACLRVLPDLAEFAAKHGVRLAFEPLNPVLFNTDTALWGLDQALELVCRIDHPALGICLDTWNVFQTPHLHATIARCSGRIFVVQVSDWQRPRCGADRRSLGEGQIDTADIVRSIRATDYAGPYVLEIFSSESLPDSIWRADLAEVLRQNRDAFAQIWEQSG